MESAKLHFGPKTLVKTVAEDLVTNLPQNLQVKNLVRTKGIFSRKICPRARKRKESRQQACKKLENINKSAFFLSFSLVLFSFSKVLYVKTTKS